MSNAETKAPVGVLALQGDFEAHAKALTRAGADVREVRTAEQARAVSALVLPGGESTTMWKLMEGTGLAEAIRDLARQGRPVLGTCAGAILLSRRITRQPEVPRYRRGEEGAAPAGDALVVERDGLGLLDAVIVRNAYGRQLDSRVVLLGDLSPALGPRPLEGVFIRAPRFAELGSGVEVLARREASPVLVRQRNVLAATFHPELTDDDRVLRYFLSLRETARRRAA